VPDTGAAQRPSWQTIDRALRTIARRRAALDAEEVRWIREADRCQLWRELGMVSALDYMERVLGYAPETAKERLRVSRMLESLPVLTEALAQGQLPYTAIRELSRVSTPSTEQAWCNAAAGKNLREIEDMLRGHRRGDRPEDPVDPEVRTRIVKLELSAETFALYRQVHQVLDDERGARLSDDELMAELCGAVLDHADAGESEGRAKFQIALTVCKRCQQGWQEGAGVQVAIDASTVERARCDAQEIGSVDGTAPERSHQEVPPSMMRLVRRRDSGRCRVPGCRSSRALEAHHIVHREHGGSHEASNLILLCSACHTAHHRGKLAISGTADQLIVERIAEPCGGHVEAKEQARNAREIHVDPNGARDTHELRVDPNSARDTHKFRKNPNGAQDGQGLHLDESGDRDAHRFHVDPSGTQTSHEFHVDARGARDAHRFHVDPNGARDTHELHVDPNGAQDGKGLYLDESGARDARGFHMDPNGMRASHGFHVDQNDIQDGHGLHLDEIGARNARRFHVGASSPAAELSIASTAPAAGPAAPPARGTRWNATLISTQAKQALVGLGWKPKIAAAAVQAAASALGADIPIEQLIVEALRRCPRPSAR
jgi:hypothetical protein